MAHNSQRSLFSELSQREAGEKAFDPVSIRHPYIPSPRFPKSITDPRMIFHRAWPPRSSAFGKGRHPSRPRAEGENYLPGSSESLNFACSNFQRDTLLTENWTPEPGMKNGLSSHMRTKREKTDWWYSLGWLPRSFIFRKRASRHIHHPINIVKDTHQI